MIELIVIGVGYVLPVTASLVMLARRVRNQVREHGPLESFGWHGKMGRDDVGVTIVCTLLPVVSLAVLCYQAILLYSELPEKPKPPTLEEELDQFNKLAERFEKIKEQAKGH